MNYYKTKVKGYQIRFATEEDVAIILKFIQELADYENLSDCVVATEEILHEWLFEKKKAEVIIGEFDGVPVSMALFFHNFSTFLGRAGIYLEDLIVTKEYRGHGFGKALLSQLAKITVERGCGRLEWSCLDWNQPSIEVYLSIGAVPQSEWTQYRLSGEGLINFANNANQGRK